eukprot:CAMPEP_0194487060 /NCGR_PEP_ID=MMETSP0253-20130528/7477_1 /TAXON_ID=2966 /ORGANISM="Noctiluca scintillans" /LENGTH=559 /DNA_ID=CAMNT_0039327233 /DNA_START=102 /DNA_END=1781 /DNA_ORIENTATION=+
MNAWGIVKFVGETQFSPGEWVGVELEQPIGKNDGIIQGVLYFECRPKHGIFIRPSALTTTKRPSVSPKPSRPSVTSRPSVSPKRGVSFSSPRLSVESGVSVVKASESARETVPAPTPAPTPEAPRRKSRLSVAESLAPGGAQKRVQVMSMDAMSDDSDDHEELSRDGAWRKSSLCQLEDLDWSEIGTKMSVRRSTLMDATDLQLFRAQLSGDLELIRDIMREMATTVSAVEARIDALEQSSSLQPQSEERAQTTKSEARAPPAASSGSPAPASQMELVERLTGQLRHLARAELESAVDLAVERAVEKLMEEIWEVPPEVRTLWSAHLGEWCDSINNTSSVTVPWRVVALHSDQHPSESAADWLLAFRKHCEGSEGLDGLQFAAALRSLHRDLAPGQVAMLYESMEGQVTKDKFATVVRAVGHGHLEAARLAGSDERDYMKANEMAVLAAARIQRHLRRHVLGRTRPVNRQCETDAAEVFRAGASNGVSLEEGEFSQSIRRLHPGLTEHQASALFVGCDVGTGEPMSLSVFCSVERAVAGGSLHAAAFADLSVEDFAALE